MQGNTWTTAQHESPVLGFCARQNKRHPMLFQSLKFIHHESAGEVKGFWPPGKGYLTFYNSKESIAYSAQHRLHFTAKFFGALDLYFLKQKKSTTTYVQNRL